MAPAALLETDVLIKTLTSSQDDAQFWSNILTPQLHTLLDAANYPSPDSDLQNINNLLQGHKALGPQPSSKSSWPSFIWDDHSPIEYSVSITPDRMIVRFAFEPVSRISGMEESRWNFGTTTKWLLDTVEKYPYNLE